MQLVQVAVIFRWTLREACDAYADLAECNGRRKDEQGREWVNHGGAITELDGERTKEEKEGYQYPPT